MNRRPTISGFFPFLNDWGTIGSLVTTLDTVLYKHSSKYEILVIDDGSSKRPKEMLKMLIGKFPKLKIITHKQNRGYGGAIKSGIKNSKYEWIFYTDGDAQYDPKDLETLIKAKKKNTDVVNGYKIKRSDPWYRTVIGKAYHRFVKALFNLPIRDTDCDFRLMRKSIFDKVQLESDSGIICVEMIKKISDFGFRFQEVPVSHFWRTSGKSQFFNFKRVANVAINLIFLWHKLVIKKEHLKKSKISMAVRK